VAKTADPALPKPPSAPDADESAVRPSWRHRHPRLTGLILPTVGAVLVLGGVFGAGAALGWTAASTALLPSAAETATAAPVPSAQGYDSSVLMPDVRGLDPNDAEQVLADAGIRVAIVSVTTRPAAGPSGVVIAQTPAFGAPSPASVSLVVSAPAAVPVAVGHDAADVLKELSDLGAQVKRIAVYVPGAAAGTVTAIDPATGSPLPEIVSITVTAAPATVALSTLSIDGDCGASSSASVDGTTVANAVTCSSSSGGSTGSWSLRKLVGDIVGTVGISDSSDSGSTATVQFIADGTVIGSYSVTRGAPVSFTLPTSGVSTLVVRSQSTTSGSSPDIVLGGFTGRGSTADIATLTTK